MNQYLSSTNLIWTAFRARLCRSIVIVSGVIALSAGTAYSADAAPRGMAYGELYKKPYKEPYEKCYGSVYQSDSSKPSPKTNTDAPPTLGLLMSVPLTQYSGRFSDLPRGASVLPSSGGTDSSAAVGFMIGIAAEMPFDGTSWLSRQLQSLNVPTERFRGGLQADIQIWEATLFSNTAIQRFNARLAMSSIGFTPTLRYATGILGLDIQVGLRLAFTARTSLELGSSTVGSSMATIESVPLTGFNAFQPAFVLRLLSSFPMDAAKTVFVQPEISYHQPLSTTSVDASLWGIGLPRLRAGATLYFNAAVLDAYRDRAIAREQLDTMFVRDTAVVLVATSMPPRLQRTERTVQAPMKPKPREMETLVGVVQRFFSAMKDSTNVPVQTEVIVRELYIREIPKPKPLITATTDAEFLLPDGRKEKRVKVRAEKTLVRVHTAPPDVVTTLPQMAVFKDSTLNSLLKPYVIADTLFTSRLPRVRFFPRIISEAELLAWHLDIIQRGRVVVQLGGLGTEIESLAERGVDWDAAAEPDNLIRANQQLAYRLRVTDADKQTVTVDSGFIKVEREEGTLAGMIQRTVEMVILEGTMLPVSDNSPSTADTTGNEAASRTAAALRVRFSDRDERLLAAVKPLVKASSVVRVITSDDVLLEQVGSEKNSGQISSGQVSSGQIRAALAAHVATALGVLPAYVSVAVRPALSVVSSSAKAAARMTIVIETL